MPSLQYYNANGTYYSLDKSTGTAQQISAIPVGGTTVSWSGQGLPPDLQAALNKPAQTSSPVNTSTQTSTSSAQPVQPVSTASKTAPVVPDSVYQSLRSQISAGTLDPISAQNQIQSMINTGSYSGTVNTSSLFAPLTLVKNGTTYGLNSDGTFKPLSASVSNNVVGAGGTTTTNTSAPNLGGSTVTPVTPVAPVYTASYAPTGPANTGTTGAAVNNTMYVESGSGQQLTAAQIASGNFPAGTFFIDPHTGAKMTAQQVGAVGATSTQSAQQPVQAVQPAQTGPTVNTQPVSGIASSLPGGTSTTLYDYYTAQGKTLPSVADRAATYVSMGLGAAGTYTGSALQNEELLSALQRQDISDHNLGTSSLSNVNPQGASTGSDALNSTDAGVSLATALAGGNASDTLSSYKAYIASALGASVDKLNADTDTLNNFFSTEQSASSILADAMTSAGIPAQQSMLTDLDNQITAQTKLLDALPDDLKNTLADVGVSQAQLDRLVTQASAGPTKALNDLMTSRNATASEINTATTFAQQFANTQIADQAAKLAALEWMVTSDKGDYNNLNDDMKTVITQGITDQKTIMTTALTAAKNGASNDIIQSVLGSSSPDEAAANAGSYLVKPAATPGTSSMTSDIKTSSSALEVGIASKGYNGRGPDGFVDPNLYVALYNQAQATYGDAGAAAFLSTNPPSKDINPAFAGTLPTPVKNAVLAAQAKSSGSSGITISPDAISAALSGN